MRALITGGYGFVGRHLAQYLAKCGDDVAVTYLPNSQKEVPSPFETPLPQTAQSIALDVIDKNSVNQLISLAQPDAIYHLAGRTFVPEGETDFAGVLETNLNGTLNILEAVAQHSPATKVLCVSSAEVYGDPWPGSLPYGETSVLRPASNYGVTKAAADLMAFKFAYRNGVDTIRVRPFPHIGPGQSDRFAISSFARQVAEIKLGRREPVIKVGNLEVKRDYSDVSDIVRGYRDALLNGKKGEAYNLCSGQSYEIGDLLKRLIKIAEVDAEIVIDPERVRPVDVPDFYGSYQKAQKDFGWRPRIELDGTLSSLFAFWVEALAKAGEKLMRIVIADDDLIVRHILSSILDGRAEIVQCATGEECLSYFSESADADYLFLDIQLPDISGPEVLKKLRAAEKQVRIISVSANPEIEMKEIFGTEAPDAFLEKPFTPEQVLSLLED